MSRRTAATPPFGSVRARGAMVASADQVATQAGMHAFALGGNAVDAAIATNATIAVTGPHLCGMGGDLFALVALPGGSVVALDAAGRAGSGADAASLRADGHLEMPLRHDIRTVTVPGCVDGWCALHDRFGSLPLSELFAPAIDLAEHGFVASPLLVGALAGLDERGREQLSELVGQARCPGSVVRRPGVAAALRAVAHGGRDAFYLGAFGEGLIALGGGWFDEDDLRTPGPSWRSPLSRAAFGRVLHTMPPVSQGYLTVASAVIADELDLPDDPDDPSWAHLLVEAATVAAFDRPRVLHDGADGDSLVERIVMRRHLVDPDAATRLHVPGAAGDTTYLCTVDRNRMGVSLIQSNASGFGSWLVEPTTGINLHDRGLGFSLEPGHPAELGPRRAPPHTLSPALATDHDGTLAAVFGTMGGDAQPQILLQVAARLFRHGASPAEAIHAARWVLRGPVTGFDTWTASAGPDLVVEGHAPDGWADGLAERGHRVRRVPDFDPAQVGHAHAIVVDGSVLAGCADPRSRVGSAAGR
jgi:gamma-glutamyltranspeptidase/glutathione hydrolase